MRTMLLRVCWALLAASALVAGPVAARPAGPPSAIAAEGAPTDTAVPVWAYYYIWFDPSSWSRAKSDTPLLGTYSSDERIVMRRHIELARAAGIDGFLVSWKDTGKLSTRLERLAEVSTEMGFRLGIVYQGLDFARRPIEVRQVCTDLEAFATEWASDPVFHLLDRRPVVVWTGTDDFSTEDIESCVAPVRDRLRVLASSRSVEEWDRVSSVLEGSAYYWSSVDPVKEWYPRKLREMGDAVHAAGGLWVAPAAPGFDARLVGGKTVVPRRGSETLTKELAAAVGSAPDAIGLISWNEFTENSHVEPSRRYGMAALETVASFTGVDTALPQVDSSAPQPRGAAAGLNGVAALIILGAILGAVLIRARWKRDPPPGEPGGGP